MVLIAVSFSGLFLSTLAGAAVREVTLFPTSARVIETLTCPVHGSVHARRAVFTLPAQVDPETLVIRGVSDSGWQVEDQSWRQITRQDEAAIRTLRGKLDTLKEERGRLKAAQQSIDAQIQFWENQAKTRTKTLSEAVNLSAAIGKQARRLYQEKIPLEPQIAKIDREIALVDQELKRATGSQETAWEVTLLLSGKGPTEISLTCDYVLSGCGWQPLYRIEARPQEGRIFFGWDAEVWQSSGKDWVETQLNIATLEPPRSLTPPSIRPWIIQPRRTPRPLMQHKAAPSEVLDAVPEAEQALGRLSATPESKSTFTLWSLGKRTLPAGPRRKFGIREEFWPAVFTHLLRPSVSDQAFVRAEVDLAEPRDIPAGTAQFAIDGASLGKRQFSFAGRQGQVYFGIDPLVRGQMELVSRQTGEQGFIADRQTLAWEWRLEIQNSSAASVRVRLEEPKPQVRDERITLQPTLDPVPTETDGQLLIWRFDLSPGAKQILRTTYRLTAPKEMILDTGLR